jgi:hypothetical protein
VAGKVRPLLSVLFQLTRFDRRTEYLRESLAGLNEVGKTASEGKIACPILEGSVRLGNFSLDV